MYECPSKLNATVCVCTLDLSLWVLVEPLHRSLVWQRQSSCCVPTFLLLLQSLGETLLLQRSVLQWCHHLLCLLHTHAQLKCVCRYNYLIFLRQLLEVCLPLFLPAAGASCPHHPRCLLQMEGGEEQQRKGVGEAGWRRQQRLGPAGFWSPLLEPHLTQKQEETLVKQLALFLVFTIYGKMKLNAGGEVLEPPTGSVSNTAGIAGSVNKILNDWVNILRIKPKYQHGWISLPPTHCPKTERAWLNTRSQ